MNFTRIIGQNDQVYRKYGDYCISEADNECCILCSSCQQQHSCEETFFKHLREMHNCMLDMTTHKSIRGDATSTTLPKQERRIDEHVGGGAIPEIPKKIQEKHNGRDPQSPMYVEAEYLENVPLNDSDTLLELGDYAAVLVNEKSENLIVEHSNELNVAACHDETQFKNRPTPPTRESRNKLKIDIYKLPSRNFLNGKMLQKLFQQMQNANNEFKYKLNMLTEEVRSIENELKRDPTRSRKCYMKILPDQPLTTRDEVLILDEELHKSKEMRDCLRDEALLVVAENADVYCRILWRFIMNDDVANQFCWRGVLVGDDVLKYPVKDMAIVDVFQEAFREKFPSQPINFFKERTMVYFNKAFERIKRQRMERKRTRKNVEKCDYNEKSVFVKANRIDDDEYFDDALEIFY